MASCNVCVSAFNKTTRREVTCAQCQFSACRDCNKRYILGSVNEPHCMNCKVPWNNDFIIENFTKKFFNEDLAEHRGNALFENEKAHMPATQERIRVANLVTEVSALRTLADTYERIKHDDQAAYYRRMANDLIVRNPEINGMAPEEQTRERTRPVCGCIREDCRGFIMSNTWKCGMCSTKVCSGCLKKDEEGHECKDEDKETRKLLLKNTKPCPKCAAMIFKTEGCSQMWCIMCHTTFDWNTMEIVTNGYVHNPHYFEWAHRNGREIPRAPGDVPAAQPEEPCAQGLPNHEAFMRMVSGSGYANRDVSMLMRLFRLTAHMDDVIRRRLQVGNDDGERERLRMQYLLGDLHADSVKKILVNMERMREKKVAQWQIAELFIRQATEAIRFVHNTRPPSATCREIMELIDIAQYCNEQFKKVAKAYKQPSWYRIHIMNGVCDLTKEA